MEEYLASMKPSETLGKCKTFYPCMLLQGVIRCTDFLACLYDGKPGNSHNNLRYRMCFAKEKIPPLPPKNKKLNACLQLMILQFNM